MKDLRATFKLHFFCSVGALTLVMALLTLPALEGARAALASSVGLPQTILWAPALAILIGLHWFLFQRSINRVAKPFQRLAREAKRGEQSFAFKNKSKSREEDILKHAVEAANLKVRETLEQVEGLEDELEKAVDRLAKAKAKSETLEQRLETAEESARELRSEVEMLKASKVAIELTLENERKVKVAVEVEKRSEEIYAQMEKAVSAAAYKSIWIPSFVQELKTPVSVIHDIASSLKGACSETSITRISQKVARICEQSETQLALLENILAKQLPELAAGPAPAAAEDATPAASKTAEAKQNLSAAEFPPPPADSKRSLKLDLDLPAATFKSKTEAAAAGTIEPDLAAPAEPEAEAPSVSPYDLKRILKGLVEELTPLAPDAYLTYSVDDSLEVEIEDEALLSLMHSLVESAVSIVAEGEISIGVELLGDRLALDIACDGTLSLGHLGNFDAAQELAESLNGTVEVERVSETELHLSFDYRFSEAEPQSETIDVIGD